MVDLSPFERVHGRIEGSCPIFCIFQNRHLHISTEGFDVTLLSASGTLIRTQRYSAICNFYTQIRYTRCFCRTLLFGTAHTIFCTTGKIGYRIILVKLGCITFYVFLECVLHFWAPQAKQKELIPKFLQHGLQICWPHKETYRFPWNTSIHFVYYSCMIALAPVFKDPGRYCTESEQIEVCCLKFLAPKGSWMSQTITKQLLRPNHMIWCPQSLHYACFRSRFIECGNKAYVFFRCNQFCGYDIPYSEKICSFILPEGEECQFLT